MASRDEPGTSVFRSVGLLLAEFGSRASRGKPGASVFSPVFYTMIISRRKKLIIINASKTDLNSTIFVPKVALALDILVTGFKYILNNSALVFSWWQYCNTLFLNFLL